MKSTSSAALLLLLVTACGEAPQTPMAPGATANFARIPNWSAWSTATPLTEINTPTATEGCPYITRSGHTLYFASNRPGGYGALDLYVSYWDAAAKQWGTPINLGAGINTAANEQCPLLLQNGKELVFISDRAGGAGGLDLWITRTHDQRGDLSWETPENLTALNTSADEFGPGSYQEHGRTVLYFNSNRSGGAGGHDLYFSTESREGTFSAPVPAAGLNTSFQEQFAALSKDGLEIFFSSDRPGTLGGLDLWHATRESTSDAWSTPVNLGPAVNSTAAEGRSSISWDGTTLFFHSNRTGSVDLYQTTRARTNNRK
jgi:Tol biopolymer transport system component